MINNNIGERSNMSKETINNILKDVIKADNVETLKSMIKNGFDINTFSYNSFNGVDAFISYKLDCEDLGESEVMNYLIENFDCSNVHPKNMKRLREIERMNSSNEIDDFFEFLDDKLSEFISKNSKNKKQPSFEDFMEFAMNDVLDSLMNEENSSNKEENVSTLNETTDEKECEPVKEEVEEKIELNIKYEDDKKIMLNQDVSENCDSKFEIVGDSNYRVSSISSYVVLENKDTFETENITINASSVEDLNNQINEKINELNSANDEKILATLIDMMNSNSEFKGDILKVIKKHR